VKKYTLKSSNQPWKRDKEISASIYVTGRKCSRIQ